MKSLYRSFPLAVACLLNLFVLFGLGSPMQSETDEFAFTQLTAAFSSVGVTVRGVSYDARRIVFESFNDYTGENEDGNNEIFIYDADLSRVIQVTKTENILDDEDENNIKIVLNVSNSAPVISGDGNSIVFTSNAKLTEAENEDGNQEIYLAVLPRGELEAAFTRITDTGADEEEEDVKELFNNYQPTINADGTLIAFVSSRRTFRDLENGTAQFSASLEGANRMLEPDGNGEIFIYNVSSKTYTQVTISRDEDAIDGFTVKGFNAAPQFSGNGQVLAFVSGFNYPGANANRNADFNGEVFLYRTVDDANTFRQLTETTGTAAVPFNGAMNILPSFTRALDFSGNRMVFESAGDFAGSNSDKTREIFLADLSGESPTFRQITNQTTANDFTSDFAFLPSLNGPGTIITFNSTLNLVPATTSSISTDNADGSKEIFTYDVAASTPEQPRFRQMTFTAQAEFLIDQRTNASFSFSNDSGDRLIFNYFAVLISPNLSFVPEIFEQLVLPITMTNEQEASLANAASFETAQIARGSIASIFGTELANTTLSTPSANLPRELGGVRVTVKGLSAQLIFVSPGQINFIVPQGVGDGEEVPFSINNNGLRSTGKARIASIGPGIFTLTSDGQGSAAAQCGRIIDIEDEDPDEEDPEPRQEFVFSNPPCAVGTIERPNYLIIYGTGWRNVVQSTTVTIGEEVVIPVFDGPQGFFAGLDQINVPLPQAAMGMGELDVKVSTGGVESKVVKVEFQ